jgi:outer membrane protein OmpA-like peptidoglycan-associated protein
MSELNATGVRAVDEAAKRNSPKVSLFYKPGEQCTLVGYTDAVRVSDAMYSNLKNKNASAIELDGPFAQAVRHSPSIPLPQNIANMGIEELPIQIDERKVKVRAIKAVGDNPPATGFQGNWTYWILDNANFPMILKGTGPFIWDVPIINTNGTIGDAGGSREGKRIVKDLEKKGIASTNAILFDFDSDKLKPSATPILNEVTTYLRSNPNVKVAVQGHCDNVGGAAYNLNLSRRRAKSVRQYLVNAGVGADRLQSEGYGYSKPVASNINEAGRAKNRRVVFKVTAK